MPEPRDVRYSWALLFARGMLGLLFFVPGWFKVFELGAVEHARSLFVEGYRDSWIPVWLLWASGFVIPFVELVAGGLLLVGFRLKVALLALGADLLIVTYGHLLKDPFDDITTHIFPRAIFLLVVLVLPFEADRWSLDALLRRRKQDE